MAGNADLLVISKVVPKIWDLTNSAMLEEKKVEDTKG